MQQKELVLYIQGNFCGAWEDVSGYPCGRGRCNYSQAWTECKHDLREYRASGQGVYRLIKRYETI